MYICIQAKKKKKTSICFIIISRVHVQLSYWQWETNKTKTTIYHIPLSKCEQTEQGIKEMSEYGTIEPSYGPWCSPHLMVAKKDGSVRFCLDYCKLNEVI